jgi:thioredoxin reductase (NADPH)
MEKVVIIGGGPAGLSAAIYLGRSGLSPLVFAGSPPGGQLMLTSEVENFPGHQSIYGSQLIEKMRVQASHFGAKIIDQNITKVDLSQSPFLVYSQDKEIKTQSLIIATGAKALWLNVPGEERLRGKGVSACATCDGFFFKDKVVAVVGGGDTAMEEALTLSKFAKEVYLIHRRDSFRASKIMQERVFKNPKIKIIYNSVVEEILGEQKVEGIKIKSDSKTGFLATELTSRHSSGPVASRSTSQSEGSLRRNLAQTSSRSENLVFSLKTDGLFVAIGHKPDTDIFAGQIELDEKGYVITTDRLAMEILKSQITNPQVKPDHASRDKSQTNSKQQIQNSKRFNNLKIDYWKLFENWKLEINNYRSATSVPGVFAAGDCVDFRYRQAATAAGSGVEAALEVERWLEEKL